MGTCSLLLEEKGIKMGLPTVSKFCFCTSLRNGCFIIGWLGVLIGLLGLGGSGTLIARGSSDLMIINTILAAESLILLIMSVFLLIGTWKRISVFLLIYLLLAGLLIAVSIANGVLTILKGGLGVGLSHMILTLVVSVYFWIVVYSHRWASLFFLSFCSSFFFVFSS